MKRLIVFDFDGTIVDSEVTMLRVYKSLAAKNNWPIPTNERVKKLRNGTMKEALKWSKIRLWQIPKALKMARSEYTKYSVEIKMFPGMDQLLIDLASRNFDVYILSSNSQKTVEEILARNKLETDITILKGSPVFSKHKILKKLISKGDYEKSESWMIGDEERDIKAGQKAGMNTAAVSWGIQGELPLKKAGPDLFAKSPKDLKDRLRI